MRPQIDEALVRRLLADQFPQWAELDIRPATPGGWDNRTFRLGDAMSVRLPSRAHYVAQVEKEHAWLPRLAPQLPLPIPRPLGLGRPGAGYPWPWSVYGWLDGRTAAEATISDRAAFASDLGAFLAALQGVAAGEGPPAGAHNFWRGGPLATYDGETRRALLALGDRVDVEAATKVWDRALASVWQGRAVWVHGDVAPGNLLVRDGRLAAVIDFGSSAVGDPACDLAIAWTFLEGASRVRFRDAVALDAGTWARARGWALWKALILLAGFSGDHPDVERSWNVLGEVLADPVAA